MLAAAAFNPINLARKLESAGFPIKQAQEMATAQAEAAAEWQGTLDLVTKPDLLATKNDLEREMHRIDARITESVQRLETRIVEKANDTIKWVVGANIAIISLGLAVLKMHG